MARRYRRGAVFADRSGPGFGRRFLQLVLLLILFGAVALVLYLGFADYGPEPVEQRYPITLDPSRP